MSSNPCSPLGTDSFGATTYVTKHLRYVESAQVSRGVKEHLLSGTVKGGFSLGLVFLGFAGRVAARRHQVCPFQQKDMLLGRFQ